MSEFDSFAHDYESALERGIAVSGESTQFFAESRRTITLRVFDEMGFLCPERSRFRMWNR